MPRSPAPFPDTTEEDSQLQPRLWVWPRKRVRRQASWATWMECGLQALTTTKVCSQASARWGQASEVCHTGKPRPGELPGSISPGGKHQEAQALPHSCGLRVRSSSHSHAPGSSSAH